ncbi:MAG: serine hydrolase, partial [Bacteroidia bacterium]|nr:serine hydrolase [Bacteroidia bacterium]
MIKKVSVALVLFFFFQSCHVVRFFIYNFADARDYRKFPEKKIPASSKPFHYADASQSGLVKLPKTIKRRNKTLFFEKALQKTGTIAFLVIRNDSILYQWYRPGRESGDVVASFSISKSFVSTLFGIAISEGLIKSIDEPITNYLDFLDKQKFGKVTIAHVLNMRSGIKFNENYFNPFGDIAKYYYGTNLKKYIRHLDMEEEPGKNFHYT